MFAGCSGDGIGDGGAGNAAVDTQMQQVAGVVIQPADDFGVVPVGEIPVGEVGLPGLVGTVGGEAVERAAGTFLGLRGDLAGAAQDPPVRRAGRRGPGGGVEVGEDCVRPGVQAGGRQLVTQLQDRRGGLDRCLCGAG